MSLVLLLAIFASATAALYADFSLNCSLGMPAANRTKKAPRTGRPGT